jgi:hypothetical protein
MKKILAVTIALIIVCILCITHVYGWGFRSHRNVNDAAIQGLPEPLRLFFDYIADLHMPLHTTLNYDGQLTGQQGVHRRFETELPQRFDDTYNWEIQNERYIENPLKKAYKIGIESFNLVEDIYAADKIPREGIPIEQLFRTEEQNGRTVFVYHDDYYSRFHEELDGMVEIRLRLSAQRVRDYWYTAWVNAGKPDLLIKNIDQSS